MRLAVEKGRDNSTTLDGPIIIDLVPCYGLTMDHDHTYRWYPLPEVNAYVEYSALFLGRFAYEPAHTLVERIKARYLQLHQVELDNERFEEDQARIDAALRMVEADAEFIERQAWLLNED